MSIVPVTVKPVTLWLAWVSWRTRMTVPSTVKLTGKDWAWDDPLESVYVTSRVPL